MFVRQVLARNENWQMEFTGCFEMLDVWKARFLSVYRQVSLSSLQPTLFQCSANRHRRNSDKKTADRPGGHLKSRQPAASPPVIMLQQYHSSALFSLVDQFTISLGTCYCCPLANQITYGWEYDCPITRYLFQISYVLSQISSRSLPMCKYRNLSSFLQID